MGFTAKGADLSNQSRKEFIVGETLVMDESEEPPKVLYPIVDNGTPTSRKPEAVSREPKNFLRVRLCGATVTEPLQVRISTVLLA